MGVPDLGGAHKAPSDQLQSPCPFQCCKGGWRFSQQSCPTPPPNLPLGQFTPSLASSRFPTSQKSQGQRGFLSLIESIPPPQYRDEKIKSQRKEVSCSNAHSFLWNLNSELCPGERSTLGDFSGVPPRGRVFPPFSDH